MPMNENMLDKKLMKVLKETPDLEGIVNGYLLALKGSAFENRVLSTGIVLGLLFYVSDKHSNSFECLVTTLNEIQAAPQYKDLMSYIWAEINKKDTINGGNLLFNMFFQEGKLCHILNCLEHMPFLSLNFKDAQGNTFLHQLAYVYQHIHTYPARCSYDMDEAFEEKRLSLFSEIEKANKIVDFLIDQDCWLKRWTSKKDLIFNKEKETALDIFMKGYNPEFFENIFNGDTEVPFFLDELSRCYPKWVFLCFSTRLLEKNDQSLGFRKEKDMLLYYANVITERLQAEESEEEKKENSENFLISKYS